MGYPMTFSRLVHRNGLSEFRNGYDAGTALHGDLNRFVENTQDHNHVAFFVQATGASEGQVRQLLALIFDDEARLTVNGMALGYLPGLNYTEPDGNQLPSGDALIESADRKRIAELEQQLRDADGEQRRLIDLYVDSLKAKGE